MLQDFADDIRLTDKADDLHLAATVGTYVLVAIIIKQLHLDMSLYTILQIFSVTVFEKTPLLHIITESNHKTKTCANNNQLKLFS